MSMGVCAAFTNAITDEIMEKAVGADLLAQFNGALAKAQENDGVIPAEGDLENAELDTDSEAVNAMLDLLGKVRAKFKEATGICVDLCYHDDDCGDRYDEVSGWHWSADFRDLYAPTQALQDLREKYGQDAARMCFYTVFG